MVKENAHEGRSSSQARTQPQSSGAADTKPGTGRCAPAEPIAYVRDKPPEFETYRIGGSRYERHVPDTLDLSERARLSLIALTETMDPAADYELWFMVHFLLNPPRMKHDFSSICDVKFLESLPLMRLATGSSLNEHVERGRLEARLRMVGDDGLIWEPKRGRPWITEGVTGTGLSANYRFPSGDCFFFPSLSGRFLGVLALHYILTGEELWRDIGRRLVDGINRIAIRRDEYAFIPFWIYGPQTSCADDVPLPIGLDSLKVAWVIQGMAQFYRATSYEPAAELAERMSRYLRCRGGYFGPEGEFTSAHAHHHGHALGLLAMADCALALNDRELLDFVRQGYEHGRALGNAQIGYFPERYDEPTSTCEACEVADMIALGVKLSQAGTGDYWDDVDRYLRNHFCEMQLTDPAWIYETVEHLKAAPLRPWFTADRVPERNVGAFAGWASANEWCGGYGGKKTESIMHCCTGNATRAIYYAWESILDFADGKLRVELLLNRASKWADVDSYIPNEGRVEVSVKEDCDVSVRMPQWATPPEVHCTVDEQVRPLAFDKRYAEIGPVESGQKVVVTFPIWEELRIMDVAAKTYHSIFRGNEMVRIDPPGTVGPLYQRSDYRRAKAGRKKVDRFVSDVTLRW